MARGIARAGGRTIALAGADPALVPPLPLRSGILGLYRAVIVALAGQARRRRLDLAVEAVVIGAYFLLRTIDVAPQALDAWLVVAALGCLVSPTSGLVILAAVAPFNEGISLTRDIGSKSVLAVALLAGIAIRWLVDRDARIRPPVPVMLAGGLFMASGLGLVRSWQRWGPSFAESAGEIWLQGVGTMLIVFVATVWIARRGQLRPLVVAVVATVVAGLISLADFGSDAVLRDGPLGWLVVGQFNPDRLTGVIRSPTSTAALVMIPITLLVGIAVLGRDRRLRLASAVTTIPLAVAAYLTYNRAVFLGLWLTAVVVGWRIRRWIGVAILVGGLGLGAVLLPSYVALRGQAVGGPSQPTPGQTLIASDQQRLTAWSTAGRMFLDEPILGQGYRAYRQLSVQFGDPTLNAPHNEWLRFFAEGGVVTGLLAAGFALATLVSLARRPGWLETGLLASFLAFCLAASFNNPFLFNQVTIPAFIVAGTGIGLTLTEGIGLTLTEGRAPAADG
jgi:hypothetical protein